MKKTIACALLLSFAFSIFSGLSVYADSSMPLWWVQTGRSTYYNSTVTYDGSGLKLVENVAAQHSGLAYEIPVSLSSEISFKFKFNQLPELYGAGAAGANGLYVGLFAKKQMYWYGVPYTSIGAGLTSELSYNGADLRVNYTDEGLTTAGAAGTTAPLQAGAIKFDTSTEYTVTIDPDATKGLIFKINGVVMGTSGVAPNLSIVNTKIASGVLSNNLYLSIGVCSATVTGASFTITQLNGQSLGTPVGSVSSNWVKSGWAGSNGIVNFTANGVNVKNNGTTLLTAATNDTPVDVTKGFNVKFTINKTPSQYSATNQNTGFCLGFTTQERTFDPNDSSNKGFGVVMYPWVSAPFNSLFSTVNCYMNGNTSGDYKNYSSSSQWNRATAVLKTDGTENSLDFIPDLTYGFVIRLNGVTVTTDGTNICDYSALMAEFVNGQFPKNLYFSIGVRDQTQTGTSFTITELNGVRMVYNALNFNSYNAKDDGKSTKIVTNITPGQTVSNFLSGVSLNGTTATFKNASGTVLNPTDIIGTGTTLNINNGVNTSTYSMVVYGDVNGDSVIDLKDLASIRNYILNGQPTDIATKLAGDFYGEGSITLNDLVGIMAAVSGSGNINQNS